MPDLALKSCNAALVFGDDACFGFFLIEFAAIELGQPELDEIGGNAIGALRVSAPDGAIADVLAKLQLELHRVTAVGTSW